MCYESSNIAVTSSGYIQGRSSVGQALTVLVERSNGKFVDIRQLLGAEKAIPALIIQM
jgi:hypothetical protein